MSRHARLLERCMHLFVFVCTCTGLHAQDTAGIVVHGFVTQGFLFSSNNNYLSMKSSDGPFPGMTIAEVRQKIATMHSALDVALAPQENLF